MYCLDRSQRRSQDHQGRPVRSDRHLGGYQGGQQMKRALLKREGISFDDAGRVVGVRLYYETSM